MKYRCILPLLLSALVLTGCSGSASSDSSAQAPQAADSAQEVTESEAAETEAPTNAPFPEADTNAVTFDTDGTEIAEVVTDDDEAVTGTLSIESIDGNNMLKLTDTSTTADNLETAVQKVRINVDKLLAPEQLAEVNSIKFDLYAEAKDTLFVNDDGENCQVPGWIGGGGGTMTADGSWYGFSDFSGSGLQEYNLQRSDACHVTFKFLLAASGKNWDDTVADTNFLIMRWGMQNISDLYIDNIVFLDADGNSIPLTRPVSTDGGGSPDAEEVAEDAQEDTTEES